MTTEKYPNYRQGENCKDTSYYELEAPRATTIPEELLRQQEEAIYELRSMLFALYDSLHILNNPNRGDDKPMLKSGDEIARSPLCQAIENNTNIIRQIQDEVHSCHIKLEL